MVGARIAGQLDCDGAKVHVPKGVAILADRLEVGGHFLLKKGFECSGEIRILNAHIRGNLEFSEGKVMVCEGDALHADNTRIDGSVFFKRDFESSGTISMHSAQIGGQLVFLRARVAGVNCRNAAVSGDILWLGIRKSETTSLDLTGAKVKNLGDDRESWPEEEKLKVGGLVYRELTLHQRPIVDKDGKWVNTEALPLDAEERIGWLLLQSRDRRAAPQPWMQLSRHLQANGDRKGAKHVLYKYRCLQAQPKWLPSRWWTVAFAWLEEVPLRILYSIGVTLALGTLVFAGADRSGAMIQTDAKAAADRCPPFQPFVYTLENAVPLVKLGIDDKWMPDPRHVPQPWFPEHHDLNWLGYLNCYWFLAISRWLLILSGWFQATVLAAALSGRFKE